jgi:hypothetical protein
VSGIEIEGVSGFEAGIEAMIVAVDAATRLSVTAGAHLIEANAKAQMNGPGPNVRTGTLRRSIGVIDTVSLGRGIWKSRIAPTVIYGRIQELGGYAGINHSAYLRPRPYMQPGLNKSIPQLEGVFRAAWDRATHI